MQTPKIAVIEDDLPVAAMYEMSLKAAGYEVRIAHDGRAGLELVKSFVPDLVLLDLKMPVMGGEEMLQLLREKDWGATIRVIVLTNISKDEAPSNLRHLKIERYIVKAHHTPKQVIEIVREVLGNLKAKSL